MLGYHMNQTYLLMTLLLSLMVWLQTIYLIRLLCHLWYPCNLLMYLLTWNITDKRLHSTCGISIQEPDLSGYGCCPMLWETDGVSVADKGKRKAYECHSLPILDKGTTQMDGGCGSHVCLPSPEISENVNKRVSRDVESMRRSSIQSPIPQSHTSADYSGPKVLDFSAGIVWDATYQQPTVETLTRVGVPMSTNRAATYTASPLISSSRMIRIQHLTSVTIFRSRTNRRRFCDPRTMHSHSGPSSHYRSFGVCDRVFPHCHALFWIEERLSYGGSTYSRPQYYRCFLAGKVVLREHQQYPLYIRQLFSTRHFMENITAYSQMFAMTPLGATVDESINNGRGPYVFKVSGQIYHWIGGLCPPPGKDPRFLQLYIYDTQHEVENRLSHFPAHQRHQLDIEIIRGLIHFLDANNALVQLFRTARDKLVVGDVVEFKVHVFGVVGQRQYELPTSDSIRAIVYDSGSGTKSDFDFIVEKHSRDPERVNKLHPSYMAFQFPLLFIHGEDEYHLGLKLTDTTASDSTVDKKMSMNVYYAYQLHDRLNHYSLLIHGGRTSILCLLPPCLFYSLVATSNNPQQPSTEKGKSIAIEPDIVYLADIKPTTTKKLTQVKVYRKWISKSIPDLTPTGYRFILLDKQGNAIQANIDLKDAQKYEAIEQGLAYRINGFGCQNTESWEQTLDSKYTLLFGRFTSLTVISDDDFPEHYFKFALYNEVCHRAYAKGSILTDYIGYVRKIYKEKSSGDTLTNVAQRKNIEVQNLKYNTLLGPMPMLEIEPEQQQNIDEENMRNRVPIRTLLEGTRFDVEVVLEKIDDTNTWYYNKCDTCGKHMDEDNPHWHCHESLEQVKPDCNYCFKALLRDATGTIKVSCFSPEADRWARPCAEVIGEAPKKNRYTIPPGLRALENVTCIFQIHFGTGSKTYNRKFVIDSATKLQPLLLEAPPTNTEDVGSSSVLTEGATDMHVLEVAKDLSTPPPTTQESISETQDENLKISSTTKRELFGTTTQGTSTPNSKKHKNE
ncbi:helitron helicase-like domain-containing protein [Artemisia annua]|uniref:Helitron helicase-like domain-containing protein n=1 Tax=Artemisia annua TaxID=35608 RepID=A0A2U1PYY8_ARTAN|nr:helitron helicase-like domain-containing protein [Artemisia annua]